jgi:DNA-binding response OmpR family regulator
MSSIPSSASTAKSTVRVIVVEDNPDLLEDLTYQLTHAGHLVRGAGDGRQLDALLLQDDCDILVLDLNLPYESGFQIAKRLKGRSTCGIIMLTARGELDDKLQGLENGADIYLVKPIDRRELIACINNLYRRITSNSQDTGWQLNLGLRLLKTPDGRKLELTPQDAQTFFLLLSRPGHIFTRVEVVEALGIDFLSVPDSRINMVMSRLRQKLANFEPELRIQTWRNVGYSYVGPSFR